MTMMNKKELILNNDFVLSFGTFFEDNQELKSLITNSVEENNTKFIYMFPIDNAFLKPYYSQFVKYEVGSEEGICALLLDTFVKNSNDKIKEYINDLDLGYISAESSAGEEEFEEAFEKSLDCKVKTLIIGNDLLKHHRIENIIKLIATIKKYSDFNLIILDEDLEKKVDSCINLDLEEMEELKSFNGTLIYKLMDKNSEELIASQTFANIAKVKDKSEVFVITGTKKIKKTIRIDDNLHGTIAILKTKNSEDIFNTYKYEQVKIQKVEA